MKKFGDAMKEIYNSNYGESLEDVADAMAKVTQQWGEFDDKRIKEMTKSAIILRDTFGYDIQETIRASNMLMAQFGITSEEGFNLIVQDAQMELDKNGDLLDIINEYSVHYKQMGLTAGEMFGSLINGAQMGTFSVDKLGDAYKEFGIRVKDTAKSTDEAYKGLGLNADKMREQFAKGGESARKATDTVLNKLFSMKDAVKQNEIGVGLFGTM